MELLNWIISRRPGRIIEFDDRFEVEHNSGEHSTLFKNRSENGPLPLEKLGDVFTQYSGVDLFSSTFKLVSLENGKSVSGVELVESLKSFLTYVSKQSPKLPEKSIPFMYQAGIGFYVVGEKTGLIYEWDEEVGEVTGKYRTLEEIFDEWLDAVI